MAKPKSSKLKHNENLARSSQAANKQNRATAAKAKAQPARAGEGKKHGPVGRSTAQQKADAKPRGS